MHKRYKGAQIKTMRIGKKVLAFGAILVLIAGFVVPLFPSALVRADIGDPDSGYPWNPIYIDTCEELQAIDNSLEGTHILTGDIDCDGFAFQSIGAGGGGASGVSLNGQGYTISNLNASLFSSINAGIVTDLRIENSEVDNSTSSGILAGFLSNSLIANVHVEGVMRLSASFSNAGGLAGSASSTTIKQSSAVVNVEVVAQTEYGGLVDASASNNITNSYAMTTLVDSGGSISSIGGFVRTDSSSVIDRSYAAGSFSGLVIQEAGGFMANTASSTVTNSFAVVTGSGVCGASNCSGFATKGSSPTLTNNYFDATAADTTECSAIVGATCTAVNTDGSQPDYFYNNTTNPPLNTWDFTDVWEVTTGPPVLLDPAVDNVDPVEDLTANIGSTTSIDLAWSMPASTGTAPLLGQVVYYQKAGETTWYVATNTQLFPGSDTNFTGTSITVNNLLPGSQYSLKVVLYNQNGNFSVASVQGVTATPNTVLISSCQDLQNIDADLTANYELTRNIDCSDTINWNDGLGFKPIGCVNGNAEIFSGVLQGNNYTIRDLYVGNEGCFFMGLFGAAGFAIIQDVTIANPTIHDPSGLTIRGVISGLAAGNVYNNIHITGDISGDGNTISGALFGVSYGNDRVSQSSFVGSVTIPSSASYFGGLMGYSAGFLGGETITNSYTQLEITINEESDNSDRMPVGGLVGGIANAGASSLHITNSYAAITVTQEPEVTRPVSLGGLVGYWEPDDTLQSFATNSFASTEANLNPLIEQNAVGGLAGFILDPGGGGGPIDLSGNYFDADRIGTTLCAGEPADVPFYVATCNPISGQPNYFLNNSTNPPLNLWDFANIWQTTSTFPVFGANRPINPIPPERLQPKNKDDPTPIHTATSTFDSAQDQPAVTSTDSDDGSADTAASTSHEGIIGRLKELFDRIPVAVLKSFPYLLFALLLLVVLALLIEMIRQRNRLHQLNILLEEQRAVAEKRDTFWHLAANYLRAPITLLMGGVDLLALGKTRSAETDKLATMSKRMQAKVASIMTQIEKSHSLQGIHAPSVEESRRVWLSPGFLLPVGAVAALIGMTNYLAREWRDLRLGTINLVVQVLVFLLVALALYWALGLFGATSRARRAAEALLVEQERALDRARMKLMRETANELDADVNSLQLTLAKLPGNSEAKPIMQEGANRLRHIIDSFQLLISAQNHQLGSLSPAGASTSLSKVLEGCLADLQPEIAAKNLKIVTPNKLNFSVPGSSDLNTQLLGSVLANSVAFSPDGGTVHIAAEKADDGSVSLTLIDHGAGISADEEEHIFQPFTKADGQAALQLDHEGLGINLYLDRQLIDYLGGEIMIHSTPDQGTSVKLQWPATATTQVSGSHAIATA